jgi:hypothetical protein
MTRRNALEVSDVARVAVDAARETSPDLTVIGTTIPAGGSQYVEILLDVEDAGRRHAQCSSASFATCRSYERTSAANFRNC